MLFLNRRGYSGFISCRECGHVVKCPHCERVSLRAPGRDACACHYCGYDTAESDGLPGVRFPPYRGIPRRHPADRRDLVHQAMFPQARVLRMDMDTTRQKDAHEKILSAFANEEADVLVGTQMIVKGHDFPNVTLVGVLAADMSLYTDGLPFRRADVPAPDPGGGPGRARRERPGRGGDPDIRVRPTTLSTRRRPRIMRRSTGRRSATGN